MRRFIVLFVLSFSVVIANASNDIEEKNKLIGLLDLLDDQDFKMYIKAANECIEKRQFSCAQDNIDKSKFYINNDKQNYILENVYEYMSNEKLAKEREDEQRRQFELAQREREDRIRRLERKLNSGNSDAVMEGLYKGLVSMQESMPTLDEVFKQHNSEMKKIYQQKKLEQEAFQKQQNAHEEQRRMRKMQQAAELKRIAKQDRVSDLDDKKIEIKFENRTKSSTNISNSPSKIKSSCWPVNEQGVRIPKEGIPKSMWCYRYSGKLSTEWTLSDINKKRIFNVESGSLESAEKSVETYLYHKAKEECAARGFSSPMIYGPNYEIGEFIEWQAKNCDSRVVMGSRFYYCLGSGTYRCGEHL